MGVHKSGLGVRHSTRKRLQVCGQKTGYASGKEREGVAIRGWSSDRVD